VHDLYSLLVERMSAILAPFDLTITDFRALRFCWAGPERAIDLTRSLRLTPASGTELIDRLEHRRLVRRKENPADRRSVLIELTPDGARLVTAAKAAHRAFLRRIGRALPPEHQARLKVELDLLRDAVERELPA
jgi:DNA-binding MarR family transcriptional regulator